MNGDHKNSLIDMAKSLLDSSDKNVSLVSIDQDGFHLKVNEDISYLQFSKPCLSNDEVRQEFIRLAKESKRE
jgi:hypothetical protein